MMIRITLFLIAFLFSSTLSQAQPGSNDPTFNVLDDGSMSNGLGPDGVVRTSDLQTDGKLIIGGNFTYYNETLSSRIARVLGNGWVDTTFNTGTGFDALVLSVKLSADGKILVGGAFTMFDGTTINRIARLNADGSLDATFDIGSGFNDDVRSIALQGDGKIVVGGDFTSFNGASVNRLVRLNADGSIDNSFNIGTGFNNVINCIALQDDGKIVVGGDFTDCNGVNLNRIARLNIDGSIDTSFNIGSGFSEPINLSGGHAVLTIVIQSNGKILVGGHFANFNGVSKPKIARLNTDGTLDSSFNLNASFTQLTSPYVTTISIQQDDKIIIGGAFQLENASSFTRRLARLNVDGTIDTTFVTGTGFNSPVFTTALQQDGKILCGGFLSGYYNYNHVNRLTRVNTDGSLDTAYNFCTGFNRTVNCMALQDDGKIVVGGDFRWFHGVETNRIARLNMDGTLDTSFVTGSGFLREYVISNVYAIAIQADGKILVGGNFTLYNGITANRIIRLNTDGSVDPTFNTGSGFNISVRAITIQADGKIIVGGSFSSFNGTTANHIIRLNSDGSVDPSFNTGTGFFTSVLSLAIQPDGKILVGGFFTSYNGSSINRIARLNMDGTLDSSFDIGTGFDSGNNINVHTIVIQTDGKILVGGRFNSYNGTPTNHLTRLHVDGSLDTDFNNTIGAFNPLFYTVAATIVLQSDGKIVVGGTFGTYNGTPVNGIIRLNENGTLDSIFNSGAGLSYPTINPNEYFSVFSIVQQPDDRLIIGGRFTYYDGFPRNHIARLLNCYPNSGTDEITACDSLTWIDGITYTESNNIANYVLTNSLGCDSLVTLNLTMNYSSIGTDVVTACDSYTWMDGVTYTSSNNTATHILTNAVGCDSLVTLNLIINNSNLGTDVITACDSFTWIDGITYTESNNTATYVLTNALGCDSLVTLNLTINNLGTDVVTACDSFTWIDGITYTESNSTTTHVLTNSFGCDSTVTLNLTINNSTTGIDEITACESFTWIDGITYTSSNSTATYVLTNAAGCDSTVTLNLTINNSTTGIDEIIACESFTWIDGVTYTSSNSTATYVLTNAAGCDSTVTLNLTINNSTTGIDEITACDAFTWIDGITYTSSNNTATYVLTNAAGCDSTVTLNLTINNSTTGIDEITACESFTWIDGITYTASNNSATYVLTNSAGCDSTVTLNLTINSPSSGIDVVFACDEFTWIDGITYEESNNTAAQVLTNAAGCDSLVTLNLTVEKSSSSSFTATACDNYILNGQTFTSTGLYTQIIANAAGCDSTIVLDLTINNSSLETDFVTACDSYTWIDGNTYTSSSENIQYILTNAAGCDSIFVLNLNIIPTPSNAVAIDGITLTAHEAGASYQWLDCDNENSPIPNETNQSFTATMNGNYAVEITMTGCATTSDCIFINTVGISNFVQDTNIQIYPNPTNSLVTISVSSEFVGQTIRITNIVGQIVEQFVMEQTETSVDLSRYESGVYFFEASIGSMVTLRKVVRQ